MLCGYYLKNPNPVRGETYPLIINLENGNRFYIDIESNQHDVETDLHVWGLWTSHGTKKLFTGAESECVDFINRIAKRLNVALYAEIETLQTMGRACFKRRIR